VRECVQEEMKNEEAAKQLQAIDAKLFKLYLSVIKVSLGAVAGWHGEC